VEEGNFDRLREMDFSVSVEVPAISAEGVRLAFGHYSAEQSARLASKVRLICGFSSFAVGLDAVYRAAIAMHDGYVEDLDAEQRGASAYLQNLSPLIKKMDQPQKTKGVMPSTASTLLDISAKLTAIQFDLNKPYW
jgi:hypothetical protein